MTHHLKPSTLTRLARALGAASLLAGFAIPAHATLVDVSAGGTGQNINVGGVRYEVIKNEVVNSPLNQLPNTGPNAQGAPRGYGIDNVFYGSNPNDIFNAVGGVRFKAGGSTLDSFNQASNQATSTVDMVSTTAGVSLNTVTPQILNGVSASV